MSDGLDDDGYLSPHGTNKQTATHRHIMSTPQLHHNDTSLLQRNLSAVDIRNSNTLHINTDTDQRLTRQSSAPLSTSHSLTTTNVFAFNSNPTTQSQQYSQVFNNDVQNWNTSSVSRPGSSQQRHQPHNIIDDNSSDLTSAFDTMSLSTARTSSYPSQSSMQYKQPVPTYPNGTHTSNHSLSHSTSPALTVSTAGQHDRSATSLSPHIQQLLHNTNAAYASNNNTIFNAISPSHQNRQTRSNSVANSHTSATPAQQFTPANDTQRRGRPAQNDSRFVRKDKGYMSRQQSGGYVPASDQMNGSAHMSATQHADQGVLATQQPRTNDPASELQPLLGNIYVLCKDQHGCRLLQRILDDEHILNRNDADRAKSTQSCIDLMLNELYVHITELSTDSFGNYLLQKIIGYCTSDVRYQLIQRISADLVAISLNIHGTRTVQRIIESMQTQPEIDCFISGLRSSVITLIKDLNGNHVIQRCLHHFDSNNNEFIYVSVARHCVSVCTHKHGCCVMQRCVDYASPAQKQSLIQQIIVNSHELCIDQFSNYIVQYILDLNDTQIIDRVITSLQGQISNLSIQKYSSNVIEKCIELSTPPQLQLVITELFDPAKLMYLLNDSYGNFVIQRVFVKVQSYDEVKFNELVQLVKPLLNSAKNTNNGYRLIMKLSKKFPTVQWCDEMPYSQQQQQQQGGQFGGQQHHGGRNNHRGNNQFNNGYGSQHAYPQQQYGNQYYNQPAHTPQPYYNNTYGQQSASDYNSYGQQSPMPAALNDGIQLPTDPQQLQALLNQINNQLAAQQQTQKQHPYMSQYNNHSGQMYNQQSQYATSPVLTSLN